MIKSILYKLGGIDKARRLIENEYLPFFPLKLNNAVLIPYFIEGKNGELKEVLLLDVIQQIFSDNVFSKGKLDPFLMKGLINSLILANDVYKGHNQIFKTNNDFYIDNHFLNEKVSKFIQTDTVINSKMLSNTQEWDVFTISLKNVKNYNNYLEKIRYLTIDLLLDLEKIKRKGVYEEEGAEVFLKFLKDYVKLVKLKNKAFEKILQKDFWGEDTYLKKFEMNDVAHAMFGFSQGRNLNLIKSKLEQIKDKISEETYESLSKKINQNFNLNFSMSFKFVNVYSFFLEYINSSGIIESIENIINNKNGLDLLKQQFQSTSKVEQMYANKKDERSYFERLKFFIEEVSQICVSEKKVIMKNYEKVDETINNQIETINELVKKNGIDKDSHAKIIIDGLEENVNKKIRELMLLNAMDEITEKNPNRKVEVRKKAKI